MGDGRVAVVPVELAGERIDRVAVALFPELSRTTAQRLLAEGHLRLDGRTAKASERPRAGTELSLTMRPAATTALAAEPIPLTIVYRDDDILVVEKPAGLVVHPAPGHPSGTLVNALLAADPGIEIGDERRPGIVHRLDRDTSGLMVVARHDRALRDLQRQMKARAVTKEYLALVRGRPTVDHGVIDAPIGRDPRRRKSMAVTDGGREARTHFDVLASRAGFTLVRARLETGRTHQIRVHFAALGCPVAGDPVYGTGPAPPGLERQFLHAARLAFQHPTDARAMDFTAPLPPDLRRVLDALQLSIPSR